MLAGWQVGKAAVPTTEGWAVGKQEQQQYTLN